MATNEKPARGPSAELGPAAERGEHWWPVVLAIVAGVGLHVVLLPRHRIHPSWLVVAVPVVLLAVLIAGDPGRIDRQRTWLRIVTGIIIALITLANLYAAVRLVVDILSNNKIFANNPGGLLAVGGVVWATNVLAFALWYWDLDRGGAAAQAHHPDATRHSSSRRCCTPSMLPPGGCRDSWTTSRWPSGPLPLSAPPISRRSGHGPSSS
jgi:hypothetical protein